MITKIAAALLALSLLTGTAPAHALDCHPTEGREARQFHGEVAGGNGYYMPIVPGWAFAMSTVPGGWTFGVFDDNGHDLSWALPVRGPSPRELMGWHFRNADNSGPNTGEVNAPQHLRLFAFFPDAGELVGIAERPDKEPQGRGALEILDYGLADLVPGMTPRMVYVRFSVCLNWPEGGAPVPEIPVELVEQIVACGLPPELSLSPHLYPVSMHLDFDGDGSFDVAAPVVREADGKRGLAICRAGTWMDVIGIDGTRYGELDPAYFDSMDGWTAMPEGPVSQGASGGSPPTLVGDALTLFKSDSSSVLLYWSGDGWAAYWQGD